MATGSGNKLYKPGAVVQKAGIYKVIHNTHREPHEAWLGLGDVFPVCKHCGDLVRYQLATELLESV
jgi:hypothetical protein